MVKARYVKNLVSALKKGGGFGAAYAGQKMLNRAITKKYRRKAKGRTSGTKGNRKKRSAGDASDQHSGVSTETVVINLGRKIKKPAIGRWKFQQNHSLMITAQAGDQAVFTLFQNCTRSQFLTSSANPNTSQIKSALFDLNAERKNSGSGIIPSTANPATDRMAVFNIRTTLMFTNMETVVANIDLYFFVTKKTQTDDPAGFWTKCYTSEAMGVATRTRPAPGVYGGSTAGGGAISDLYAKPTDLAEFRGMFKLHRVHHIKLGAGATEELNIYQIINKIYKYADLTTLNLELQRGATISCMAVAYGQAVHDLSVLAASNVVTTSSVKVACVMNHTFNCGVTQAVGASRHDDYLVNNQVPLGAIVPNQQFVDIQDAIASVEQA